MSRKAKPTTLAIIAALKADPKAKPLALAKEHGVAVGYVYKLRKQMAEGRRKITLARDQVEIAKKLGVSLEDYVKEGLKMGALKYDGERPIVNPAITMETDVDAILDSRAKDYGRFKDGAALMQGMKRLMSDHARVHDKTFADDQWEALEMIVHKIARIINGNPDKVDHWVDIAGYATLVAERLEGNAR
jgi:hypothetical protein